MREIFSVDKENSKRFKIEFHSELENKKGEIIILPFSDLNKWIIYHNFSLDRELIIGYYKPMRVSDVIENLKESPSVFRYIFDKTDIFSPLMIDYLVKHSKIKPTTSTGHLFILSEEPFKCKDAVIYNISNGWLYDAYNEEMEQYKEINKFNITKGDYFYYFPPQIFLEDERSYFDVFGPPNLEIIFKKEHKKYGKFIIWNHKLVFVEESKFISNSLDFVNLFFFFLRIVGFNVTYIISQNKYHQEKIFYKKNSEFPFLNKTKISNSIELIDPLRYDFYSNYWYIDNLGIFIPQKTSLLMKHYNYKLEELFELAYHFSIKILKYKTLSTDIVMFFEALSNFISGDYYLCYLTSWNIIERFIDIKWEIFVENFTIKNNLSNDFRKHMLNFQNYSTSEKIYALLSHNLIETNLFNNLKKFNKIRNKVIHDRFIPDANLTYQILEVNLVIIKKEYQDEIIQLINNFQENFNLDYLLNPI
ncbi:MAG: hypothetical protein ACTSUC_01795 [Promethearchaeota archaeon]